MRHETYTYDVHTYTRIARTIHDIPLCQPLSATAHSLPPASASAPTSDISDLRSPGPGRRGGGDRGDKRTRETPAPARPEPAPNVRSQVGTTSFSSAHLHLHLPVPAIPFFVLVSYLCFLSPSPPIYHLSLSLSPAPAAVHSEWHRARTAHARRTHGPLARAQKKHHRLAAAYWSRAAECALGERHAAHQCKQLFQ